MRFIFESPGTKLGDLADRRFARPEDLVPGGSMAQNICAMFLINHMCSVPAHSLKLDQKV